MNRQSGTMSERMSAPIAALCARGSLVVSLCLLCACGSTDAGFTEGEQIGTGGAIAQAGSAGTAGSAGSPSEAAAGSGTPSAGGGSAGAAEGSGDPVAGAPAGGSPAMSLAGSGGGTAQAGSGNSAGSGATAQAGSGNSAGSGGVCSSGDACTACLCRQCPTQVKTCESTPGCQAVAECVATNKCSGIACYCGTADTLSCAAGTANGPCRDVILSAPGARKPTLINQSAGPATDAASAVANCGAKSDTGCTASCQ